MTDPKSGAGKLPKGRKASARPKPIAPTTSTALPDPLPTDPSPTDSLPTDLVTQDVLPQDLASGLLESEVFAEVLGDAPQVTILTTAPPTPLAVPTTSPASAQQEEEMLNQRLSGEVTEVSQPQDAEGREGRAQASPELVLVPTQVGRAAAKPPQSNPAQTSPVQAATPPSEIFDELEPMYPESGPFLMRFLPRSPATYLGLRAAFSDLRAFFKYLHERRWNGYLYAALQEHSACVLIFEGRIVAASSAGSSVGGQTGEQALAEMLRLYEQGAELSGHALSAALAHVLSGVGNRAWKFDLTEDFTGVYAGVGGAIFYSAGEVIATMNVSLPQEGAFPSPLRPQTLLLPRSLASWAHRAYQATLRGRDSVNAITEIYPVFRGKYGNAGLNLMRALLKNQTPAEYALREDIALHELEPLIQDFISAGYLRG